MSEDRSDRAGRRPRKVPRAVTPERLDAAALHYLERFAASAASLRRVLMRRVRLSAEQHGTDPAEAQGWVEALIGRYIGAGLIDDASFAEARAQSLARRGTSRRGIQHRLAQKGIGPELVERALGRLETGDLAAAAALARRRRLGPWRPAAARREYRDRDMAVLGRAGFDYATTRAVLDAADPEAVEELLRGGA
jgi:regulatory protein